MINHLYVSNKGYQLLFCLGFKHHCRGGKNHLFQPQLAQLTQSKPSQPITAPISQSIKPTNQFFPPNLFIFPADFRASLLQRRRRRQLGGVRRECKLGGRTNTFITPRLCQTHMGSVLRTRGSSAPAAERRAPSAPVRSSAHPPWTRTHIKTSTTHL